MRLPLTFSRVICHLLFIYFFFQVNTGVSYLLDYVEDIYEMVVLSAPVSILNPNPMHLSLPLLYLNASGEEDSQLEQDGSPLDSGQEEMASNLRVVVDISSSRRSFNWLFWGGWYLDVEKPICHLSLLPILLNCVRSHMDLYCVRSVRASSSSDR